MTPAMLLYYLIKRLSQDEIDCKRSIRRFLLRAISSSNMKDYGETHGTQHKPA